jgi:predicted kinase
MVERVKLFFLCGKMAAGKSTLARELAQKHDAVLLVQDEFLVKLFPRRDRRHSWLRQVLVQVEGRSCGAHMLAALERCIRRARLSRQHQGSAGVVS